MDDSPEPAPGADPPVGTARTPEDGDRTDDSNRTEDTNGTDTENDDTENDETEEVEVLGIQLTRGDRAGDSGPLLGTGVAPFAVPALLTTADGALGSRHP